MTVVGFFWIYVLFFISLFLRFALGYYSLHLDAPYAFLCVAKGAYVPHNAMHLPQCRKQVQRDFSSFWGEVFAVYFLVFFFFLLAL